MVVDRTMSDLTTSKIPESSDSVCCFCFFTIAPVWHCGEEDGVDVDVDLGVVCGVGVGVKYFVFCQVPSGIKTY